MNSLDDFNRLLEQEFDLRIASFGERMKDSASYAFHSGGKRLRPRLVYELARQKISEGSELWPAVIKFATNVECIHTFSLVHDDLPSMDDSDFRRGKESVHKRFDEATALLSGSQLFLLGFYQLDSKHDPLINRMLIELLGDSGLIGGQLEEFELSSKPGIDDILGIFRKKTGALFALSLCGAYLILEEEPISLDDYISLGLLLGQGFQIADDIIDFKEGEKGSHNICSLFSLEEASRLRDSNYQEALSKVERLRIASDSFLSLIKKLFYRTI